MNSKSILVLKLKMKTIVNNEEQTERAFYFWIGNPDEGALSVTEEEFNQLYEAKRKLQDDFINARIDVV